VKSLGAQSDAQLPAGTARLTSRRAGTSNSRK
jgi:hypothetical protein